MTPLTDRMERARDQAGLTVSEMARWLGVHQPTLFYWLNGKRSPQPYKARALMERTGWLEAAMRDQLLPVPAAVSLRDPERRKYLKDLAGCYERHGSGGPGGSPAAVEFLQACAAG